MLPQWRGGPANQQRQQRQHPQGHLPLELGIALLEVYLAFGLAAWHVQLSALRKCRPSMLRICSTTREQTSSMSLLRRQMKATAMPEDRNA